MDETTVLELLQQTLADAGFIDEKIIRRAALELAVSYVQPPPVGKVDLTTLFQRVRASWGLDYASILNEAAIQYTDTTLTASEVLQEIANNLTV